MSNPQESGGAMNTTSEHVIRTILVGQVGRADCVNASFAGVVRAAQGLRVPDAQRNQGFLEGGVR